MVIISNVDSNFKAWIHSSSIDTVQDYGVLDPVLTPSYYLQESKRDCCGFGNQRKI